ncbi:MAG: oleate hydratase, partial [Burkholderiales bacterium PBB5]
MTSTRKAYFIGGGIGSLAGAAFLIRDGGLPGGQITILEAGPVMGGSLDGAGDAERGYTMRGGRMLTTDNYECTWDLFKSIPSVAQPGRSVFDETLAFNEQHMGFSMGDRVELLKLVSADEASLGASCITDHLSPAFFETEFWFMWVTTFAFQPWHSAVEFRRYLHRFMLEFSRIETLAGVKRTVFNQYDSLVVPLQQWLAGQGVRMLTDCTVTDIDHRGADRPFEVIALHCTVKGQAEIKQLEDGDLVFLQNGSMTDASSLGSMTAAPAKLKKAPNGSWTLWE